MILIKEATNCPNCGTTLVDFAAIESDGPFWLKFNFRGQTIMAKVVLADTTITSTPEFYTMPGGPDGIRDYTTLEHIITATFHVVE